MALGPKQMGAAILRNLETKTGKNLLEWLKIIEESGLREKKQVVHLLKKEHHLGHFQAQKIYENFIGKDMYEDVDNFENQLFSNQPLKLLYNQLKIPFWLKGKTLEYNPAKPISHFITKINLQKFIPMEKR